MFQAQGMAKIPYFGDTNRLVLLEVAQIYQSKPSATGHPKEPIFIKISKAKGERLRKRVVLQTEQRYWLVVTIPHPRHESVTRASRV